MIGPKTSGQKYLTNFIGTIESYLHPANLGKWIKVLGQLLVGLPEYFSKRLEFERFRKCDWMDPVPGENKYNLLNDNPGICGLKSWLQLRLHSSPLHRSL